ncbi:MAG: hypothetical protein HF962_05660 [Sulfurovum sp.]|nr:hypothetical protein [Sulfurovum sp.]
MYNVEKLEQQWKLYRRKKIVAPVVSTLVVLIVASGLIYVVSKGKNTLDINGSVAVSAQDNKSIGSVAKGKILSLGTEVPSLGSVANKARPKVGQIIFQGEKQASEIKVKKRKNLLIQVTERGGKDIAVDIENRFEFAKDKSDSLFLAKYYYDKMEYSKAEKWALETNKLDSTLEESWLIFAKAQAKQGKRIESLKVLKAFIDQSGSTQAKSLMDKIRRGKSF